MRGVNTSPLAVALIFGALALSSCSSSQRTDAQRASATPPVSAECDQATVAAAIQSFYSSTEATESTGLTVQSVGSVQCADDWAVAQIVVGDGQGHDLHDYEVVRRSAGIWTVADRMTICGTWNPKKPAQMPDDAAIVSSLYAAACATN